MVEKNTRGTKSTSSVCVKLAKRLEGQVRADLRIQFQPVVRKELRDELEPTARADAATRQQLEMQIDKYSTGVSPTSTRVLPTRPSMP